MSKELDRWEAQLDLAIELTNLLDKVVSLSYSVEGSEDVRYLVDQAVDKMDYVAGRIALTAGRLRRQEEQKSA